MGCGKKNEVDDVVIIVMCDMFDLVNMVGIVVIGEGEFDEVLMLYIGEELGMGNGLEVDIVVDLLEGINIVVKGFVNVMVVIVIVDKGNFFYVFDMYMEKIVVGLKVVGKISLDDLIEKIIEIVVEVNNKKICDLIVIV